MAPLGLEYVTQPTRISQLTARKNSAAMSLRRGFQLGWLFGSSKLITRAQAAANPSHGENGPPGEIQIAP